MRAPAEHAPDIDLSDELLVRLLDLVGALLDELLEVFLVSPHLLLCQARLSHVAEHQGPHR